MTLDFLCILILTGVFAGALIGYHASITMRNARLREAVEAGCQTAGSLAYYILVNSKESAALETTLAQALEAGLRHVNEAFPDTLGTLKLNETTVMNMIKGSLAKLLAADPTVSPAILQKLKGT